MEVKKFVLHEKPKAETKKFRPIQLYEETLKVIEEVAEISGETKASLVQKMVMFAYDNMEIIRSEE